MWTISFWDIQALLSQITKKANVGPLIKHIKEKWEHFCRFSRVLRSPNIISSSWHYHVKPVPVLVRKQIGGGGGGGGDVLTDPWRSVLEWPVLVLWGQAGSTSGGRVLGVVSAWTFRDLLDHLQPVHISVVFGVTSLISETHYCSSSSN